MSKNMKSRPSKTRTFGRLWMLFRTAPQLMLSSKVPLHLKAIFGGAIVLYWILPDLMPFIPIDDMVFTMILIPWFTRIAEKYQRPTIPTQS
ncbi:hypothetical protein [Paenibacillus sp. 1001270B_150601_E10]|uniref:hypothetical protein n=1 Tax=Paenibacillus sp. 1001270B_150601_E10 TaxID=2787079 RepID=UPI001E4700CE|nr:hypothetical protein [Paenibacillus sp. 1001270B_150601_E10]